MVLANVVVGVVAIGACALLMLDSPPAKTVWYVFARWRHRRRVGASSRDQHTHAPRSHVTDT
jgi:hypothetical protein